MEEAITLADKYNELLSAKQKCDDALKKIDEADRKLKETVDSLEREKVKKEDLIERAREFITIYESGQCPHCNSICDSEEARLEKEEELSRLLDEVAATGEAIVHGGEKFETIKSKRSEVSKSCLGVEQKLQTTAKNLARVDIETTDVAIDVPKLRKSYEKKINQLKVTGDGEILEKEVEDVNSRLSDKEVEFKEVTGKIQTTVGQIGAMEKSLSKKVQEPETYKFDTEEEYEKEIARLEELVTNIESNVNMMASTVASLGKEYELESKKVDPELKGKSKWTAEQLAEKLEQADRRVEELKLAYDDLKGVTIALKAEKDTRELAKKDAFDQVVESQKSKVAEVEGKMEELGIRIRTLSVYEFVTGDQGVRTFIMRDIIPDINKEIVTLLAALGLPFVLTFDADFKPTIYKFGDETSPKSCSTGQRAMMNLAIVLSIISVIKMRYPTVNMAAIDEFLNGIHVKRLPLVIEIIKDILCRRFGMCAIVMNHSFISESTFDVKLEVLSKNNLSYMETTYLTSNA
jgi:DNA repair exonuclease SbcCD ATPase subunit